MSHIAEIVDDILHGRDNEEPAYDDRMAAKFDARWNKNPAATFYVSFDKRLAENLVNLSEAIANERGLSSIRFDADRISGVTLLLLEHPHGEYKFSHESPQSHDKELDLLNVTAQDYVFDTYIDVNKHGIVLGACTNDGHCVIPVFTEKLKKGINEVFEENPAMRM